MVRKIPQHLQNVPGVPLPSLLIDHHKIEDLGGDFIFVNDHVFLVTTSFNINFRSIINMLGSVATEAANCLKTTISSFTSHKINIETVVGDNKF